MKKFPEMKNALLLEKNLRTVVELYKIKTNAKTINTKIMKITGKKISIAPYDMTEPSAIAFDDPRIKFIPGLSNPNIVLSANEIENVGIAQNRNLLFFLKNGNAIIKIANGNKKNWIPPQDANPSDKNIPAKINFTNEILPLSVLIADKNK